MSEVKYIQCDGCQRQVEYYPPKYGSTGLASWIEVKRAASTSSNKIQSGQYHFCTEKCLKEFLK